MNESLRDRDRPIHRSATTDSFRDTRPRANSHHSELDESLRDELRYISDTLHTLSKRTDVFDRSQGNLAQGRTHSQSLDDSMHEELRTLNESLRSLDIHNADSLKEALELDANMRKELRRANETFRSSYSRSEEGTPITRSESLRSLDRAPRTRTNRAMSDIGTEEPVSISSRPSSSSSSSSLMEARRRRRHNSEGGDPPELQDKSKGLDSSAKKVFVYFTLRK